MNENEKYLNEDSYPGVSSKFSADLKAIFKPDASIPPEVDRAIMDTASQHFIRRQRMPRIFRISAAAAAVIVISLLTLELTISPRSTSLRSDVATAKTAKIDIDRNGDENILDAFELARHIESTTHPNIKWDINGDGEVNRKDVDYVAYAAVRLDKGVML